MIVDSSQIDVFYEETNDQRKCYTVTYKTIIESEIDIGSIK